MSDKAKQIFNKVILSKPKRNSFDLSHDRKFTAKMGLLYPCLCEEVYPSESWYIGGQSLVRTAPMVAPMMHTVNIFKHYFFVPDRILWANWDLFITGGDKFNSTAPVPVPPFIVSDAVTGFPVGSVADYLGFPTGIKGLKVSAIPFAAYYRIVQEYYNDENLMDTELFMLTDGDNTSSIIGGIVHKAPMPRCWERDYFTSALPEPQKGPEVTIPLGTTAPLKNIPHNGKASVVRPATAPGVFEMNADLGSNALGDAVNIDGMKQVQFDITEHTEVDLSAATSATVNSWRLAMAVQKLYERLSRGGSRTIEFLRAVWDSNASSSRLDRPEYFGGAKEPLSVSEVLQTSETDGSPQGNMAGHGVAVARINSSEYHTSEYGVIIGMFSVMPRTAYSQGIRKSWLRLNDRFDYFFPDLAHIGEQPILNAEVYADGSEADKDTFGYLPYGTELRYINDSVHGEFRSTQDFWHMGRLFENRPHLNEDFVSAYDVTRRVFADLSVDTDTLYCHLYHRITAKRCIPMFGTPS